MAVPDYVVNPQAGVPEDAQTLTAQTITVAGGIGPVELRLSGDPADITAVLDTLAAAGISLVGTSRPYSNRRGAGVRVYTHAHLGRHPAETDEERSHDE